ncbi:MAG: hypothetical protein Q9187_001944 [Circinaria calcarea]
MASSTSRSARSRRTPIRKKPYSSSVTSLVSAITNTTSSSSGSNSTVTQESVSRPRQPPSKSSDAKKESSARHRSRRASSKRSPPAMSPVDEKPNVFAFMEEDEDGEAKKADPNDHVVKQPQGYPDQHHSRSSFAGNSVPSQSVLDYQPAAGNHHQVWDDGTVPGGSFYSDSGISVRSSSPERDSPILQHKFPSNRAYKKRFQDHPRDASQDPPITSYDPRTASPRGSDASTHSSDMNHGAYYNSPDPRLTDQNARLPPMYGYLPPQYQNAPLHPAPVPGRALQKRACESKEDKKPGYDHLASSMSSNGDTKLKPIYRKFETLHNRMLLHLQDEISELETKLQEIDALVAEEKRYLGIKGTSRRVEARMHSLCQWNRVEIMWQVFGKLDQYSLCPLVSIYVTMTYRRVDRALSTYNGLSKSLDAASQADINFYKQWMAEHTSIHAVERSFLDYGTDLAIITRQKEVIAKSSDPSAVSTGLVLLSTIIAFKLVPQFCSRVVIGAIVCVAMFYSNNPPAIFTASCLRDYVRGISISAGLVLILAIAVG